MYRYIIIYTFLIAFGHNGHKRTEQYGRLFYDRRDAVKYYRETIDDCFCDSTKWNRITRQQMKEGAVICVEMDSLLN
jgi:hypothetical protein